MGAVTEFPYRGLTTLDLTLEASRVYAQDPIRALSSVKRMRKRKELLKFDLLLTSIPLSQYASD